MITNSAITIYNFTTDPETRLDKWSRTVLKNVHVHIDNKVAVTEKGVKSADIYRIRVPADVITEKEKKYIPSEEYKKESTLKDKYWTISKGDIIVVGECSAVIEKPSDLTKKGTEYCKINSFSDNRFGCIPHWRIVGE